MDSGRNLTFAYIKAVGAVVVWGVSFVATKIVLAELAPMPVVWLRFGIGLGIVGASVAARRQLLPVPRADLWYFALLGFIGIAFHQWLQSNGMVTASATSSAWIVATIPIFTALLSALVLKERLGPLRILGILLAAGGVLLIVSKGDVAGLFRGTTESFGDFLVLLSAPNWAVFSILSRRSLKRHSAQTMLFYVMCIGWLIASLDLPWMDLGRIAFLSAQGWIALLFLGIFCSGIAYIFYYDALKMIPASRVGSLIYLEPLVTTSCAALLLGERAGLTLLLGAIAILTGVWFVNRPSGR